MKRSIPGRAKSATVSLRLATSAIDLAARLAVPGAVIAVTSGQRALAIGVAASINLLALGRGILVGKLLERATVLHLSDLIQALQHVPLGQLRVHASDQSSAVLVAAAQRSANVEAIAIPRLVTDVVGLCLVSVTLVLAAPLRWLALGVIGLILISPPLIWLQRNQRRVERAAFSHANEVIVGTEALFLGCEALRAHGQDGALAARVLAQAVDLAKQKAKATRLSSLVSLVPLGVTLLALTPATAWLHDQATSKLALLGALAAAWLALFLGAIRAGGDIYRSGPERQAHKRFLEKGRFEHHANSETADRPVLRGEVISFDSVALCHEPNRSGQARLTPAAVDCTWNANSNLALVGPNGSGKTSLIHALLGLIEPWQGAIRVGDTPVRTAGISRTVAYLPQRQFVAPSKSIRWHFKTLCGSCNDEDAMAALDKLGLGHDQSLLQRPLGHLSGGEQTRVQLARLLLPHHGSAPELVILDEPEANLDAEGLSLLRQLLEQWPQNPRILLIAHTQEMIPVSYQKLNIRAAYAPHC